MWIPTAVWFPMEAVHFPERTAPRWTDPGHTWRVILQRIWWYANLADRCQVSLAYAIGMAEPVMVQVETFGTGRVCADDCLAAAIPLVFGLSPKQICDTFRLKRPIFQRTAVYGHFGRKEFPWERIDKTEELRNAVM